MMKNHHHLYWIMQLQRPLVVKKRNESNSPFTQFYFCDANFQTPFHNDWNSKTQILPHKPPAILVYCPKLVGRLESWKSMRNEDSSVHFRSFYLFQIGKHWKLNETMDDFLWIVDENTIKNKAKCRGWLRGWRCWWKVTRHPECNITVMLISMMQHKEQPIFLPAA